jgi:hypothetical protein
MTDSNKPDLPAEFGNPWMSNLEEIELPERVLFTPETIGWYLLAGALALGLLWVGWRFWRRWRANAYRREALAELKEIETAPERLPALLKRVALVAYPRAQVAELSGDAWLGFLDGTLGTTDFSSGSGHWLPELAYDPGAADRISQKERKDLFVLARRWIQKHHPAERLARRPVTPGAGKALGTSQEGTNPSPAR